MIIDPPRKGCDEAFLDQLLQYAPRRVVYVSCGPDTQVGAPEPLHTLTSACWHRVISTPSGRTQRLAVSKAPLLGMSMI